MLIVRRCVFDKREREREREIRRIIPVQLEKLFDETRDIQDHEI